MIDFVAGLQNDWTPASAIRFSANNDPVARHLSFSILCQPAGCKAVLWRRLHWYPCSLDPCLRLQPCIDHWQGSYTLKKYDLAEHFKSRRPEYVTEWVHEMMWGKTRNVLVKRAVELVKEVKQRHSEVHLGGVGDCAKSKLAVRRPEWPLA